MLLRISSVFIKTLFAFAFLFCFQSITAQVDTSALSWKLNQSKDKLGKNYVFMLYKDGKILYKKENQEFNPKTQQPIGATSQWLTAALVMSFVQEGKIDLDDKVGKYLPIFEKYYKGYITIRHCLTYYTGIKPDNLFQKSKYHTLEEEVKDYASKKEIETNAGTESRYSNIGFNIAGRVLEVISKRSFDRLMLEIITRPCGMKNTTFANEDYNQAVSPAIGARSSAADLTNFLAMLLNKGSFNNKPVLSESSVSTLLSLQVTAEKIKNVPAPVQGLNYGLGSWISDISSKGDATAFTAPAYTGTVPVLDICRKYQFVIFTKELSSAPGKDFYLSLKAIVDESLPARCD